MRNPIKSYKEKQITEKEKQITEKEKQKEHDKTFSEMLQNLKESELKAQRIMNEMQRDYQIHPIIEKLDKIISLLEKEQ